MKESYNNFLQVSKMMIKLISTYKVDVILFMKKNQTRP